MQQQKNEFIHKNLNYSAICLIIVDLRKDKKYNGICRILINRIFLMKKTIIYMCFIIASVVPAFADTMAVQAVTYISTEMPDEIIKVKIIRDCKLADISLKEGYILEGKILGVTAPKRLKKNASFTFYPINYIDLDGKSTHIPILYIGTFSPKFEIDGVGLVRDAALTAGNKFIFQGLSLGFYAVQGAIENREDNFLASAVNNVYEHSLFSYIEKGKQLEIAPTTCFGLKFNECENAPRTKDNCIKNYSNEESLQTPPQSI